MTNALTITCIVIGLVFMSLGTIGLLRFPDVHSRLHALTKADNLGLGFTVLGLLFQVGTFAAGAKLVLIWVGVMLAATTACYLVARQGCEAADLNTDSEPPADGRRATQR